MANKKEVSVSPLRFMLFRIGLPIRTNAFKILLLKDTNYRKGIRWASNSGRRVYSK